MGTVKYFCIMTVSLVLMFSPVCRAQAESNNQIKVIQVTPDQFNNLTQNANVKTIRLVMNTDEEVEKKKKEIEEKNKKKDTSGLGLNFSGSGGNSGEVALIIFAVVGLVIIIAWIPYFPTLAYKAIVDREKIENQHSFALMYSEIDKNKHESPKNETRLEERRGSFSAFHYTYLLKKKDDAKLTKYGLSLDVGYHHIEDKVLSTGLMRKFWGNYFMVGPALQFQMVPELLFFQIDLMAGSSDNNEVGLMTTGRINLGFNFGIFSTSLFAGGFFIDVDDSRGLVSRANNIMLSYGLKLGFPLGP